MLLMTKCLGLTVLWITLIANLPTIDSGSRTEPNPRPLPVWYDEAKFGVMIHWGLFSVPSYGGGGASEWFWKHWKDYHLKPLVDYMSSNYKPGFSYADFAEQFTAELYNPDEWVDMISKSGAKYVVMTSKHHEGFCNWPTNVSFSWRSVDVGPHRDLLGDFAKAVREKSSMKLGIYHSLYEWFNPLYLTDKANKFTTNLFSMGKTIPELYELVNTYKPSLLWSDGEWEATADYWNSTMFINWLYNQSPVKDEVVVNNRWGANGTGPPGDYKSIENQERIIYKQKSKWENAVPIDSKSWGFRRDAPLSDYLSSQKLIRLLVQAVSMGGNFLMNIGPTADGRIPMIFQERLRDIGAWLAVNGEAIYSTTVWSVCQIDRLNSNVWYTQRDSVVYGTVIETWPSNSTLVVSCPIVTANTSISLLGAGPVTYTRGAGFIAIHLPPYPSSLKSAWTFKFTDLSNAE